MSKPPIVVKVQAPVFPPGARETVVYDEPRSFILVLDLPTLPRMVRDALRKYPKAYFLATLTDRMEEPIIFHRAARNQSW
jgi:hypothetical protein